MYSIELSDKLEKIIQKLFKKDRVRYEIVFKKINEIVGKTDFDCYKNLSYDMKEFKRVHIDSHFVLTFKVDKTKKTIKFEDLQHHDTIYR